MYLGLGLMLFVVYLHQGALMMALWLIPALVYINLVTLLFAAIYYDSLVARFLG